MKFNFSPALAIVYASYITGRMVSEIGEVRPSYTMDIWTPLVGLLLMGGFFLLGYMSHE